MNDLVEWLRPQLDRDTAVARELAGRGGDDLPTGLRSAGDQVRDAYGDPEPPEDGVGPADRLWWLARDAADWAEAWSPTRVLRDIDAKRRIVECHEPWTASNGDTICGRCGREHIDGRPGGHFPCQTLRLLALPYADRPGYQEEWRP